MAELEIGMMFGLMVGAGCTIVSIILYKLIQNKMYPIRVPMLIQRGKGIVWDLGERAKYYVSKNGIEKLILMKRKSSVKPPKYSYVTTDQKGKDIFPMFSVSRNQHFPMELNHYKVELGEKPKLDVIEDKSAKNWAIQELQRTESRYGAQESALLRYAPFIMNAMFAAMVIFVILYVMSKMEVISGALAGASDMLSKAMTAFKGPQTIQSVSIVPWVASSIVGIGYKLIRRRKK